MSAVEAQIKSNTQIVPKTSRQASTGKPTAGPSYSPALLPASMSQQPVIPIPIPKRGSPAPISEHADEEAAAEGGSEGEGQGTPKATPQRPSRSSVEFDFDAFMEANQATTWEPNAVPGWLQDQPHFPVSARPSIATQGNQHQSLPPAPRVYMQTTVMDSPSPLGDLDFKNPSPPPIPPPRPHTYTSSQPQSSHAQSHMQGIDETTVADVFRSNPVPRVSLKRNRWGDGLGGRRMEIPMREESIGEAHPPPVYSTDGDGDEFLESGGPVRQEKALLPLNEEFKRRCLAVLHEVCFLPHVSYVTDLQFNLMNHL